MITTAALFFFWVETPASAEERPRAPEKTQSHLLANQSCLLCGGCGGYNKNPWPTSAYTVQV